MPWWLEEIAFHAAGSAIYITMLYVTEHFWDKVTKKKDKAAHNELLVEVLNMVEESKIAKTHKANLVDQINSLKAE